HCTTSASTGRQIVVPAREVYDIQRANRTAQQDPQWKRRYHTRAGVEGTISQATRAHHLRHCRYTGLAKTRVQHALTACAINAARIADWAERDNQPAPTPVTFQDPLPGTHSELANRVLAEALAEAGLASRARLYRPSSWSGKGNRSAPTSPPTRRRRCPATAPC